MDATLTWLDLTASDRDRMRQVLDLFKEQGTVDEMASAAYATRFPRTCFPEPPQFKRDCVTCCSSVDIPSARSKENRCLQCPDTIAEG